MQGRMIAIVGPSGVGKDTVMAALQASRSDRSLVKRHITRSPDPIGEDHYALSNEEFCIALEAVQKLRNGQDMLINLSRDVLEEADRVFDRLIVINLTAPKDVLLSRLEKRGREPIKDIKARLEHQVAPLPKSLQIYEVPNDHHISETLLEIENILFKESQNYERNFA
jgi:ribose 1,5-bisphosphokinase